MVALVAVGVMNIPVMVGIALLIALEKRWRFGEAAGQGRRRSPRLAFAVLIVFDAGLAPGLHDSGEPMDMDDDMPMP